MWRVIQCGARVAAVGQDLY